MLVRWSCLLVVTLVALGAIPAEAQDVSRRELARELATLVVDDSSRRGIEEQVGAGMMQAVAVTLEQRLARRLQEAEWRMIAGIVRRFVADTLPGDRAEGIAAEVYARHFDEAELRELLRFQRSAVGMKARRLTPLVARETAEAMEREIRSSPVLPRMLQQLADGFPILGAVESP
jgi:hypothetical protein